MIQLECVGNVGIANVVNVISKDKNLFVHAQHSPEKLVQGLQHCLLQVQLDIHWKTKNGMVESLPTA